MKEYEDIQIERDRSKYPTGLRHYNKDSIWENSLFDFDLILYKLTGLMKGDNNGETDKSTQEEIL